MRKKIAVAAILTAALCLSACGGKTASSSSSADKGEYGYYAAADSAAEESYAYEESAADDSDVAAGGADNGESGTALRAQDGQKIVYTGSINIQTLEYDKSAASIRQKIKAAGGFTESESEFSRDYNWYSSTSSSDNTRNLSLTARIPSEKFEAFMSSVEGDGKIMGRTMNAENISQVYANKEAYKQALEKEQKRLLEMMDKAETIDDMIAVEARLSEVERELNSYNTDLSAMDKDVQYSTIYIELQEVKRYSEEVNTTTFGEEIRYAFEDAISSFRDFCEGVVLFVVRHFPYLILWAIVLALVIGWLKRRSARRYALMTNPEYAKVMTAKLQAKAEAEARKRAEKEAKKRGRKGLFGKKAEEDPKVEQPAADVKTAEGADAGDKAE